MDPQSPSPLHSEFDNVDSVDVLDPVTLKVSLKQPFCPLLSRGMTASLIPEHVLGQSRDLTKEAFNTNPTVTSGPYTLQEWSKGDHITLVANPGYWRGKPKIERWVKRIAADQQVLTNLLKTGEIDYANVQTSNIADLDGYSFLSVVPFVNGNVDFIAWNLDRPLLQDARVRRALAHLLDRKALVQSVLDGYGQIINGPIPPVSWAYNPNVPAIDYDLDKARALLQDAGWMLEGDGVLRKDGAEFRFTLSTNNNDQVRGRVCVIVQDALKKVGIQVDIKLLEINAFQSARQQHDFDANVDGLLAQADPDPSPNWASSSYPKGLNFSHYSNPEVDRLLQQARSVADCSLDSRKALYDQFQVLVAQDQPVSFLYALEPVLVFNKRLQGLTPSPWTGPTPGVAYNAHEWTLSS